MAAQQAPKASPESTELVAGSAKERALAELLLLRCGDTRLIGNQVIDQAKLCGQAVRAAFDELSKAPELQE